MINDIEKRKRIERIERVINISYADVITADVVNDLCFIPMEIEANTFFVIVCAASRKIDIAKFIKDKYNKPTRFITLKKEEGYTDEDYEILKEFYLNKIGVGSKVSKLGSSQNDFEIKIEETQTVKHTSIRPEIKIVEAEEDVVQTVSQQANKSVNPSLQRPINTQDDVKQSQQVLPTDNIQAQKQAQQFQNVLENKLIDSLNQQPVEVESTVLQNNQVQQQKVQPESNLPKIEQEIELKVSDVKIDELPKLDGAVDKLEVLDEKVELKKVERTTPIVDNQTSKNVETGKPEITSVGTGNSQIPPMQTFGSPVHNVSESQQKVQPLQTNDASKSQSEEQTQRRQDPKQLTDVFPSVANAPRKRIGDLLKEAGYVNDKQLLDALVYSRNHGVPLGSALVEKGFITVDVLKHFLHEQQGTELVDAKQLKIAATVVSTLPLDFIKSKKVVPLSNDGKTIVVGMVNPNDKRTINDIIRITGGLKPDVKLLTHYEFQKFIDQNYGENYQEANRIIKNIETEILEYDIEESLFDQVEKELQDKTGSVAQFVNKIITNAIDQKASDVHIEPRLSGYDVRYRVDGILKKVLSLPSKVEAAVITRFKVLAKMNIAEFRRPQDGTFFIKYNDTSYDFRINTLPVGNREKMVIRILAPAVTLSAADKDIKLIGATEEELHIIKEMTMAPNGIILAAGPTGSGKTTTLYSILKSINDPSVNITTIEDPVEIKIDGINQSQVNPKAGITFASCMRAILRQDPDIILVGEIRDMETLEVAISAALTGHLVLSTVHTNSAATTVTRLIEMGAKDYLVSSTLQGVVAQRLVRKLCDSCKVTYQPTLEDAQKVIPQAEQYEDFMAQTIYKPVGCPACNFEGYRGRLGVYEILRITKEIRKLIAQGAHGIEIEEAALGQGMKTLQQACMGHILRGETTINEFVRVLGLANE